MWLRIEWLYPRNMGTYGDRGNILALEYRCRQRGITPVIKEIHLGDRVAPDEIDLFFLGGGQDKNQTDVAEELEKNRDVIAWSVQQGSFFLGICGGYQLLGHTYVLPNGQRINGLGLLDIHTVPGKNRLVGPISVLPNPLLKDLTAGIQSLIGFENHGGRTILGNNVFPLGTTISGHGNNGTDGTEGSFYGTVFGTYLHGPLLPLNPSFCDFLIKKALERRHGTVELPPLDNSIEEQARVAALFS